MIKQLREEILVEKLREQLAKLQSAREIDRRRYQAINEAQALRRQIIDLGGTPVVTIVQVGDMAQNAADDAETLTDTEKDALLGMVPDPVPEPVVVVVPDPEVVEPQPVVAVPDPEVVEPQPVELPPEEAKI